MEGKDGRQRWKEKMESEDGKERGEWQRRVRQEYELCFAPLFRAGKEYHLLN